MSQGSLTIADGDGAAVLAAINAAFARLATKASGTGRPSDIATGEFWIETDNPGGGVWSLWFYDGASDILFGTINSSTHAIAYTSAGFDGLLGSTKGMLAKRGASSWAGLAVGSAWQGLRINAAGDDVEYADLWQKIAADAAPSGAGSVSFSSIPAAIKRICIDIDSLIPATDGAYPKFTLLDSGGSEITSSVYHNEVLALYDNTTSSLAGSSGTGVGASSMSFADVSNNTTSGGLCGSIRVYDLQSARHKRVIWDLALTNNGTIKAQRVVGAATVQTTSTITGVKFAFNTGNVGSGALSIRGTR